MTLPDRWTIAVYVNHHNAPAGHEAVAHLFAPSTNPKTGKTKIIMQPATATASDPMVAAEKLIDFLNDEIKREADRKERGRLLAKARTAA